MFIQHRNSLLSLVSTILAVSLSSPATASGAIIEATEAAETTGSSSSGDDLFSVLNCSACEGTATLDPSVSSALATLDVWFVDDAEQDTVVDLEVVVIVAGTAHTILVEQVTLEHEATTSVQIEAGTGWQWLDADRMDVYVHRLD